MNTSDQNKQYSHNISVAPMMDWTDRHCRYFHRLISPNTQLYTEMVTTGAIIHGDAERFLRTDESVAPVVLQLGGSSPQDLATCAKIGEDHGYDEINLNCGCPSDRVQNGRFGAIMMKEPDHVADCVEAMIKAVNIPVSVKCRIGVDECDSYDFLSDFINKIADKGCTDFVIHARKAWLKGLSPKENRTIPPINYTRVSDIKGAYPDLKIILNGEIKTIEMIAENVDKFDGFMIGREAYQNPYFLSDIESDIFKSDTIRTREEIAIAMVPYIKEQMETYQTPVKSITRHMIGLFHKQPSSKAWRQTLSTLPHEDGADETVVFKALEAMDNKSASV